MKTLIFGIFLTCLLVSPGISKLNTDPSLLSYFSKSSPMYRGLSYIDQNGGSSPLTLVIRDKDFSRLTTGESFNKMWDLQEGLELHKSVGGVISLPVLLGQAQKEPLAFFLSKSFLVKILEGSNFDEGAKGFITSDRRYGLYLLRMYENGRTESRLDIIEDLKENIRARGLVPKLIGGVYSLQGSLSKLVVSSLVTGLGKLLLIFTVIIWGISRSIKIALATAAGISLIPIAILGISGLYGIPLDIVSAPASNVAIGLGIDSIIHMINNYRRRQKRGENVDWGIIREELYRPIFTSAIVVATGFIIFLLSVFPPLQRFGVSIVLGACFASLIALYIAPLLFKFKLSLKN